MKKNFIIALITLSLLNGAPTQSAVTTQAVYKISVTIPPHVDITGFDPLEKEKPSLSPSENQIKEITTEETLRNNFPIILKTTTIK